MVRFVNRILSTWTQNGVFIAEPLELSCYNCPAQRSGSQYDEECEVFRQGIEASVRVIEYGVKRMNRRCSTGHRRDIVVDLEACRAERSIKARF
jgi:hypothetical protein